MSMTDEGNGTKVSYTVKELLARLEGKIDLALGSKADKSEMERMERKFMLDVERLDSRVDYLEKEQDKDIALRQQRKEDTLTQRFMWNLLLPTIISAMTGSLAVYLYLQFLHH